MRRWTTAASLLASLLALGCHREVEMIPLVERNIYITDRFYDVQAVSKDRAVVVGYGGKILDTRDGGNNWTVVPSGVEDSLFSVKFVDEQHGWITGQEGLVLHTADGGKTWERQDAKANFKENDGTEKKAYLFAVDAIDNQTAWAVGDRSMLSSTTDGGKTWRSRKVKGEIDLSGGEQIAAADPIFYDVKFVDAQHGWIAGEFGKILHTKDGGETWHEQSQTLMEGGKFFDVLDLPTLFGLHMTSAEKGVAAGLEGHVARTSDGGARWSFDAIEVPKEVPLVDPLYSVTEISDGSAWVVGAAGEVLKREAGADTWKRAKIGQDVLTWLRSVDFSDPKNGWMVGGFGLIFRTTDGGKTWLPSQG